MLLAALLLGAGILGYRMREVDEPKPREATTEVRAGPHVIAAVKELALLQGATYHMERVVDLREKQPRLFGLIEVEDAILLVAGGDVTAGVDLSKMVAGDVAVENGTGKVEIVLPAAEVLSTRLDNERTYVHSRATDLLATQKIDLESSARREAEVGLRDAAVEAGLLATAEKSVARTVAALVTSLGHKDVQISFRPPLPRE